MASEPSTARTGPRPNARLRAIPRRFSSTPRPIASQSKAIEVVPVMPLTAPCKTTMATLTDGGIGESKTRATAASTSAWVMKQRTRLRFRLATNGEYQATITGAPVNAK